MSSRTIIRTVAWKVCQDTAEGAPTDPLYQAEYTTCLEQSEAKEGDRIAGLIQSPDGSEMQQVARM